MPFTPFHMGPGILFKAMLQGSFSLMVFGWSQIIMDLQPLFVLLSGAGHLHGFSHTYLGASLLLIVSALSGKYLSETGLRILGLRMSGSSSLQQPLKISWRVTFISAAIGTYSHVLLDSMMHSDIQPFYPFDLSNQLLQIISIKTLHQLCLYSGLLGAGIYYGLLYKNRGQNRRKPV